LAGLQAEIARYQQAHDPLRIVLKRDPKPPQYALRLRLEDAPPIDHWGLVVGDIAHNMRSALDYVAWALTGRGPQGVPTRRQDVKKVQFPIVSSSETNFNKSRVKPFLRPADFDRFKRFQPYHRRHPNRHPLAVLSALNNEDKHRVPQVAIPTLDCGGYRMECVRDGTLTHLRRYRRVTMKDNAKLASFRVHRVGTATPEVRYDGDPEFFVGLANGHRVWGDTGSVYSTLGKIGVYVGSIVNAFALSLGDWEGREAGRPFIWIEVVR